jgi:hypothetical protein
VQLESHATPPLETPQQRYANLHRAIERGLDSDDVWKELAEVSLALGHGDEAVRCMRRLQSDTLRLALQSRLSRLGLVAAPTTTPRQGKPLSPQHPAAPAASDAGRCEATLPTEARFVDHVLDAFQYQLQQHMPAVVLLTTLAFPAIVGLGGFLTAGGSLLLLAAIAAVPGLCVLAVLGAMGRQVLVSSAAGDGDVPPIPGFAALAQGAQRSFGDAVLVLGSLLGPSLLAWTCGAPWPSVAAGLAVGGFFAPAAWALRQLRGDLAALSPVTLLRAVARTARSYPALAAVHAGLFLPAAGCAWLVFGRPVWVQVAVIGPLLVLPIFVGSRLLGTWVEAQRERLGSLLQGHAPKAAHPDGTKQSSPAAPAAGGPSRPRFPRKPESMHPFAAPAAAKPAARSRAAAPPAAAPTSRQRPAAPSPAAPAAKAAGLPPAKPPTAPTAKPAAKAIEGRGPSRRPTDAPDLTHMPGAVVVSGTDRQRQGAAARPR